MPYTLLSTLFHFSHEEFEAFKSLLMGRYTIRTETELSRALRTPRKQRLPQASPSRSRPSENREKDVQKTELSGNKAGLSKLKMPEC